MRLVQPATLNKDRCGILKDYEYQPLLHDLLGPSHKPTLTSALFLWFS